MKKETEPSKCCCNEKTIPQKCHHHNNGSAIYGLGVIGALFYFLQGAASFTAVIIGIGKAFFWPAILMFKLLTSLQM